MAGAAREPPQRRAPRSPGTGRGKATASGRDRRVRRRRIGIMRDGGAGILDRHGSVEGRLRDPVADGQAEGMGLGVTGMVAGGVRRGTRIGRRRGRSPIRHRPREAFVCLGKQQIGPVQNGEYDDQPGDPALHDDPRWRRSANTSISSPVPSPVNDERQPPVRRRSPWLQPGRGPGRGATAIPCATRCRWRRHNTPTTPLRRPPWRTKPNCCRACPRSPRRR